MRKLYLFLLLLSPIATMILPSRAFAADPPKADYDRAMAAFKDGTYHITTEVNGIKYYIATDGRLTDNADREDLLFSISKSTGGALYSEGLNIDPGTGYHFTNTNLSNSKAILNPENGTFALTNGNNRNDWERQVPFMNEEGKIAIRSCNTAYGESSWADAGRAFWTYEIGEFDLTPCYSYDAAYVWSFELPSDFSQVKIILNSLFNTYADYYYDDKGYELNMGTEFGQRTDYDSWKKFRELLDRVNAILEIINDPGYDNEADPDACPSLDEANSMKAEVDSLYQAILDSEVPYVMPQNGYYRILAHNRYKSTYDESGFVDKAMAASFSKDHLNKVVYSTLDRERANFIWKLTKSETGDSIMIQNAGMGTYISLASKSLGKLTTTADVAQASYIMFDYAGLDYVEPDGIGDDRDIVCIRLTQSPRAGGSSYFHQNNHSSVTDETSPWGNYGVDTGTEQEMGFWMRTWDANRTTDKNTSEWYLEFVPEDEAEQLIKDFEIIKNHDVLVAENNALRAEVLAALTTAKDIIRTKMIASADQLSSPNSDPSEGANLGNLIDNNTSTFWHTSWHSENQEPQMSYGEGSYHYLQISGMEGLTGDCEFYFNEREGADNDRPTQIVVMGSNDPEAADEEWQEVLVWDLPHTGKGEANTLAFNMETGYAYLRVFATQVNSNFRTFWHVSELQFYTVRENPNSQYAALGEIAENLESVYNDNCAVADEDITLEIYEALLNAYKTFLAAMVDPAELRAALAAYADATKGVVEGKEPGQWKDTQVASQFEELYAEIEAYDKAGRYTAAQNHKYAVMLKAMSKSVMEGANGVSTDKWYRIMFPTEEMYDAYSFGKDGGDNCGDLAPDDQKTMWGTFVSAAKLESEEVTDYDDEGNEVTKTNSWIEAIGGEDLRESDRLFFVNEDDIEDKSASMFRFVETKSDDSSVTPLFTDVKDNMLMALDLSTTYTQGEPLITEAAQLSSNASYPGNDGGKLEEGVLIDNNVNTYWHSDYSKTYNAVPYLQVALNEPVSGMIQVYVARRNTGNGHVVRMYVQGSNDAETWTNVGYVELPYVNATTPVTSQPIDLGGSFSHLRFTMTQRYGTDGGSNIEFDPFAENLTADDYNTKYTYFHASEFQVYPVTADSELSASAKALQDAYSTVNKVVLKDATAEDLATASQAYKAYQSEFNAKEGKAVLPNGKEKVDPVYALQNKATGLFVMVNGTGNQDNVYLKTVPTLVGYKALGYQRSLLSAKTVEGVSCNNLHGGESNRRLCTWSSTEPTTNSGLVIREAEEEYAAPAEFSFYRDIKPGRINAWCASVTLTPEGEGTAYTPLGYYFDDDNVQFLALKKIETLPAGEPAFYIYEDTTYYDSEAEDAEPMKFTMPANEELVLKGDTINGVIGSLVNHTLPAHEIYFSGNRAVCIGTTGYYLSGPCVAVDMVSCPEVDPAGDYDFSICLGEAADKADGIDVAKTIEKVSQRGNVYSMDGKLLRTGATLNSLKSLGKGMYILNGVKVAVK